MIKSENVNYSNISKLSYSFHTLPLKPQIIRFTLIPINNVMIALKVQLLTVNI